MSVAVADLNSDGRPDLVVAGETSNTISVFQNTGSNAVLSFELFGVGYTGTTPRAVTVADLNSDGLPEVIIANSGDSTISIFPNSSAGWGISLGNRKDYTTGNAPVGIAVNDFNGDGRPDIAVANSGANRVAVLTQRVNALQGSYSLKGFFSHPTNPALTGPVVVTDGSVELRTLSSGRLGMYWQDIPAHPITSNGSLTSLANQQPVYSISGTVIDSVVNSFTATTPGAVTYALDAGYSNRYDVPSKTIYARYGYSGRLYTDTLTWMSPLEGSFAFSVSTYSTGLSPAAIAASDMDGDGKADIVVTNSGESSVSVFRNTSTAAGTAFAARVNFTAGSDPRGIALGDLDNDGRTDVALTNGSLNRLSVLRNTGSTGVIALTDRVEYLTGTQPWRLDIGDMNGNGSPDIAVSNRGSNSVSVFENISTGSGILLAAKTDYATAQMPEGIALADIDLDGKLDITVAASASNVFSLLRANLREPVVSSFTPQSAFAGNTVTIRGNNFTGTSGVSFNGNPAASFSVVSDTVITAVVGVGSTGSVRVVSGCGTGQKAGFIYSGTPAITGFTPASGAVGTTVTVSGSNFNTAPAGNLVRFGNVAAVVLSASGTSLTVKVPAGAVPGPISVTTSQLTACFQRCNTLSVFNDYPV